jgi:diacylglycerol O-acyltransferase / wax synthase
VDSSDCGEFGLDRFRQTLARRLHLLEPLRYRLVDIPARVHHPMWLENCDVDLDYHVRRMQVAAPGGHRELDAAIAEVASTPLDRNRPLWEFHFVEGMADNRFAIIGKVHHALADGVASANLMALALDLPDTAQAERNDYRRDPAATRSQLIAAAARDHVDTLRELPCLVVDTAKGVRRVRRKSTSVPGLARNFHPPVTFLNHVVTPGRTFASATLDLADVKSVGKHLGATINDMVLAISAGALRTLLLKYDGRADEPLLGGVPMTSTRRRNGSRAMRLEQSWCPSPCTSPILSSGCVSRGSVRRSARRMRSCLDPN